MYYSQSNQDKWVAEFLEFKKNGYFIEVGAYDGIQTSNTYFFEKNFNWSGICIEANPSVFNSLIKNRKSVNVNKAVTDYKGTCNCKANEYKITNEGISIDCDTLLNILDENNAPNVIDYLSIDIEGYEYIALKEFDFIKYEIGLITVEHNLYCDGDTRKNQIFELLTKNGFSRVVDNAPCLDPNPEWYNKPYEDWYVNNKLLK